MAELEDENAALHMLLAEHEGNSQKNDTDRFEERFGHGDSQTEYEVRHHVVGIFWWFYV